MRILILGDSSSAGIGPGLDIYPYRLFCRLEKSARVEIQNHSTPGFTSADAARYFRTRLSRDHWDAVVVYLGNNEGGPSTHKGAYRPFMDTVGLRRRRSTPTLSAAPVVPRDFDLSEEPTLAQGSATTPGEFSHNLAQIVTLTKARGAEVVLISPFANRAYPASAGPLLSPFFKIVGTPASVGHIVTPAGDVSTTLVRDAIRAEESGEYERAVDGYNTVLSRPDSRPWLLAVASNNMAVALHRMGRNKDAETTLKSQASAGHAFSSIASYNLGRLLLVAGRRTDADEWFTVAAEQDIQLYRVKKAYRDAIADTAVATGAHLLRLDTILTPRMFVDYCHPTAEAHEVIASALSNILGRTATTRDESLEPRYRSHCPSPNAFFYCDDDLVDYYGIAPSVPVKDIESEMAQIAASLQRSRGQNPLPALRRLVVASPIQRALVSALTHAARHPIVTSVDDFQRWPVRHQSEIGRLPEHYIYRLLLCYLDWALAHGISYRLGSDDIEGESDPRPYYRRLMIGWLDCGSDTRINLDDSFRRRLRQRVLAACQHDDLFRDLRGERLVTVLRWYTREAFRYGTQSRLSMLYPVASFDAIVEALRVWMIIARCRGDAEDERLIRALYEWLRCLERLHRRYASQCVHQQYSMSERASLVFRRALSKWRTRFPGWSWSR